MARLFRTKSTCNESSPKQSVRELMLYLLVIVFIGFVMVLGTDYEEPLSRKGSIEVTHSPSLPDKTIQIFAFSK
jgi:hypothetical protein